MYKEFLKAVAIERQKRARELGNSSALEEVRYFLNGLNAHIPFLWADEEKIVRDRVASEKNHVEYDEYLRLHEKYGSRSS